METAHNLISLDEIKEHLNIDKCYFDDDAYLVGLIGAAGLAVEKHARINLSGGCYNHPLVIHAVKLLVGTWYRNREASVTGLSTSELPYTFEYLIKLIRSYKKTY